MTTPDARTPPKRRPKRRSTGYAIGALIVEIDQRLLRNLPPTEVLVAKGDVVRGLAGDGGVRPGDRITIGDITVELPARDGAPETLPVGLDDIDAADA